MNFDRIRPAIDVDVMAEKHVTVVGGAFGLLRDLVRCGVRRGTMVDFDHVSGLNVPRQDFYESDVGRRKIDAVAADLRRINPEVDVELIPRDFCEIDRAEFDALFGGTDLFIFAADAFPPQARGNFEALRLNKPAIWIGLYAGARAGEIIVYVPGVTPACFRCVASARYAAFRQPRMQVHVPSAGGTILDLHLVDAIAGQLAVGILTRGAQNRFGRLIDQLGDRSLLQVKLDPSYTLAGRDIFGEHLGTSPANFGFTTIALPQQADPSCPDCIRWRQPAEAVR